MYQHILIATDGSEIAQRAVEHGIAFAAKLGATLTFVVVSETITGNVLAGQPEIGLLTRTEEIERAADTAAQRILGDARQRAAAGGISCDTVHLRNMTPSDGILETADKKGCDLIVMGSQGWGRFARFFLGSQAVDVIAGAKIPVLIVK